MLKVKKIICFFMVCIMAFAMLPGNVIAADVCTTEGELTSQAEQQSYWFSEDGRKYSLVVDKTNGDMPTLLLPGTADLSNIKLNCSPDYDGEIIYNGVSYGAGAEIILDFTKTEDQTVAITERRPIADGGETENIVFRALKSNLEIPTLYLDIDESKGTTISDMHATKGVTAEGTATILGSSQGDAVNNLAMTIKGRGNASWKRDKKSYQIKLDKKKDVLGMSKSKKWILLPSSADLSCIRSAVGMHLAQELGMEFASNWRFVDFYMNGEYYGLFILCEKVELAENRIDISSIDDALEDAIGKDTFLSDIDGVTYNSDHSIATLPDGKDIDLTGGYHLEFDNYEENVYQFSTKRIDLITVKEPEMLSEDTNHESYTYIKNFVQKAENAIYSVNSEDLKKYIDLESFAKMWLLKEYISDSDATKNMHFWKESDVTGDGLIHAGIAWDFDNSMGRDVYDFTKARMEARNRNIQVISTGNAKWLGQLLNNIEFKQELKRQYNLHKDLFTCCSDCECASPCTSDKKVLERLAECDNCGGCYIHNFVAEQERLIRGSLVMDTIRWTGYTNFAKNADVTLNNRELSTAVLKIFSCGRNTYLKNRMACLGVCLHDVTFVDEKNGTQTTIPVGSKGLQNLPEVADSDSDFVGWFYTKNGKEVEFTSKTSVTKNMTVKAKWS